MINRFIGLMIWVILVSGLVSCNPSDKNKNSPDNKIVTVTYKNLTTHSYYSGVIQPLKTMAMTSPADGVVEELAFHYGEVVKAKQTLFTIYSDKFQTDYKNALLQYIKAKTEFNHSNNQWMEAQFLHKNDLISDDDFKAKKTSFYTAQLSLMQAKDSLNVMLKQLDVKKLNLDALSIEEMDKINQALHIPDDSHRIHVVTPVSGIALLPIKNDGQEGQLKKITRGDAVKQGDLLAMIGDVNGLAIHINVNEFTVNALKVGQKVKVTGAAFPEFILQGEIASIDHQGQGSPNGVPQFPVEITIPSLPSAARAVIQIGMSAKVEIAMEGDKAIILPIAAVFEKKGAPFVTVKKGKSLLDVSVKTGKTTIDGVVIESNLKEGDQVVIAS